MPDVVVHQNGISALDAIAQGDHNEALYYLHRMEQASSKEQ